MTTVGVIGLGDIGSGVAKAIPGAGFELVVCDLNPEAVAQFAASATVAPDAASLGEQSDVIVVAVVNDAQVHAVLDPVAGALSTAKSGSTVLIVSTISMSTLEAVAATAAQRGVGLIDCGVSGGPQAAADGQLVSMVGGDQASIDKITPVLEAFSSLVVPMGALGTGLRAKLARNIVQYGSWLAAYEAQVLAEAAGIELAKLAQVIRASDQFIGGASRLMFRDTVAPLPPDAPAIMFDMLATAAGLAHKDLGAALELADSLGVDLPMVRLTDDSRDDIFYISGRDNQ
jgi:3-hydroxyisobutyrate dehydrogenase-like beta-hydroxyacid dehydrogenase